MCTNWCMVAFIVMCVRIATHHSRHGHTCPANRTIRKCLKDRTVKESLSFLSFTCNLLVSGTYVRICTVYLWVGCIRRATFRRYSKTQHSKPAERAG